MADISHDEYVGWVKRSLNRQLGAQLAIDGSTDANYRSHVKRFQENQGLAGTGEVDSKTQNAVILASEEDRDYLKWVHETLGDLGIATDPPRSTPDDNGRFKSHGLKLGIQIFQEKHGLTVDGFVGAKTETELIDRCQCQPLGHVPSPSPPRQPEPELTALNRSQTKIFVWALIGEKPEEASFEDLAREFVEFTEIQKLLKKPSILRALQTFGFTFFRVLATEFGAEPPRQYGYMIGCAYCLIDRSNKKHRGRRLKSSSVLKLQQFSKGFNRGYRDMEHHLDAVSGEPQIKTLMARLGRARETSALKWIYQALLDVTKPKFKSRKEHIYFRVKGVPTFSYPKVDVEPNP